jgi:hypothetical protein
MSTVCWDQTKRFFHRGDTVTAGPYYEETTAGLSS